MIVDGKIVIEESYWIYDPLRRAYCHLRAGAEVPVNESVNLDDEMVVDCTILQRHAKQFLDYITREHPELITLYKGRDSADIKIINRLLDIVEKEASG